MNQLHPAWEPTSNGKIHNAVQRRMFLLRSPVRRFAVSTRLYSAMKEAIVYPGPKVKIIDSPIPTPKDDEVVTKVIVSGSNPRDWKWADISETSFNQGTILLGLFTR